MHTFISRRGSYTLFIIHGEENKVNVRKNTIPCHKMGKMRKNKCKNSKFWE